MGKSGKGPGALFVAVVLVGLAAFLLVGLLANSATRATGLLTAAAERVKNERLNKNERHPFHRDVSLNYVSKRKVPNGPDPIHNRRAEVSKQPPAV